MDDYELTQIYHAYVKELGGLQQHCDAIIEELGHVIATVNKLSVRLVYDKSMYNNALTAIRKWHRDRAKEAEVVSLGVLFDV